MSQENPRRTARTVVTPVNYVWELPSDLDLRRMEGHLPTKKPTSSYTVPQEPPIAPSTPALGSEAPSASESTIRRSSRLIAPMSLSDSHPDHDPFGTFYQVDDDQPPGCVLLESLEERIDFAHNTLRRLGFTSVWDLALVIRRGQASASTTLETENFFTTDCAKELVHDLVPYATPATPEATCTAAKTIYLPEWERLRNMDVLTQDLDPSDLSKFNFNVLYPAMQQTGPMLVDLFDHLSGKHTATWSAEHARKRYVVLAIGQLAHRNNPRANFIQTMIGLHLYASNVPSRIYPVLNHLGISVSAQTIRRKLSIAADAVKDKLLKLAASGKAFPTVFDNLNSTSKVRDQRIMNEPTSINYTTGYVLQPPDDRSFPIFNQSDDLRTSQVPLLNTAYFVPTDDEYQHVTNAMKAVIEEIVYEHGKHAKITLPPRQYRMPVVQPIPRSPLPEILPLPTYDLNEAEFQDMVEILYSIQEQVGMSQGQAKDDLFIFAGDLMTVTSMLYLIPNSNANGAGMRNSSRVNVRNICNLNVSSRQWGSFISQWQLYNSCIRSISERKTSLGLCGCGCLSLAKITERCGTIPSKVQ
jgi:hypothetical protein